MNGFMEFAHELWEWSAWVLSGAIGAGVSAALLAGVAVIINVFCRRWISARQMGWLWGFVLLRLLIPEAPTSPCSLQNVLHCVERMRSTAAERATPDPNAVVAVPAADASSAAASPAGVEAVEPSPTLLERILMLLPWIWLAGSSGFLV